MPFQMRPIYDVLLRGDDQVGVGLHQLNLATAEQLCRLHYSPGSIKTVKRRLKAMADAGYVQADAIPVKYVGVQRKLFSAHYYYTLGPLGAKYLEVLGFDVSESWRASKEVNKHGLFVEHTLELNDVIIAAAMVARADQRFYLGSFTHERVLKRQPYKTTADGKQIALIPDAFLDFRHVGSELHFSVLLEHDRGTEEQFYFKRKIRGYLQLLKTEDYRTMFGTRRITVAFTTFQGERRLEQMRNWTRQVLASSNEPQNVGSVFRFAALPQPLYPGTAWLEARWRHAYENEEPEPLLAA